MRWETPIVSIHTDTSTVPPRIGLLAGAEQSSSRAADVEDPEEATLLRVEQHIHHAVVSTLCAWTMVPTKQRLLHRLSVTANWISESAESGSR